MVVGTERPAIVESHSMSNRLTTLGQLAALVNGRVLGDTSTQVQGADVLREVAAGEITLVDHVDRIKRLQGTPAAAVVVSENVAAEMESSGAATAASYALLVVSDVHVAFAAIVAFFRPPRCRVATGISPRAIVGASARWGKD